MRMIQWEERAGVTSPQAVAVIGYSTDTFSAIGRAG
jgi:hypothetical protein